MLPPGSRVRVDCTYENERDDTLGWGPNRRTGVCLASLGVYPDTEAGSYVCFN